MTLKQKAMKGALWEFSGRIGLQGVGFFVSVILARILAPEDFGLLAIVTVFIYLAAAFVMASIFLTYWVKNKLILIVMGMRRGDILVVAGEVLVFSIMIPLVIIFLRPINQFIYFQF